MKALHPPPQSWKGKLRHKFQTPRDPAPLSRKPCLFTSYFSPSYLFLSLFSVLDDSPRTKAEVPNHHPYPCEHWAVPHNLHVPLHHPKVSVPSHVSEELVKISPDEELNPGEQRQAVALTHLEFGGHQRAQSVGAEAVGTETTVRRWG